MKDFKAGHQVNQGYYKSFQPSPINKNWDIYSYENGFDLEKFNNDSNFL